MPGSLNHAVSRTRAVRLLLIALALAGLSLAGWATGSALAAPGLKTVSYRGFHVRVPRDWPVYHLAQDPRVCVRFNRHAVYLGTPGNQQSCPAHAAGRTEAILLQPAAPAAAAADAAQAAPGGGSAVAGAANTGGSFTDRANGLVITATWGNAGGLIRRALGLRSLNVLSASSRRAAPYPPLGARTASGAPATPGGIYTGRGFDVCSTPSTSRMAAWGSSPYRAVGVYIGGANRACAQPNLTPAWVSQESATGWHMIPIYVGLQAPSNSCGCAAISGTGASAQGGAAATDAVSQAESLGMGPGNPIYFDMEAYSRPSSNSSAVLTFLAAWTSQLHALGYRSGVYSSEYSAISDLVSRYGTGYAEPDEIWVANWNGARSTSDANVPSSEWAAHQRLHQYSGDHNETYGGVTINIDGDYLDAATAATGSSAGAAAEWSASRPPTISGQAMAGQTLLEGHGTWSGAPTAFAYQWEDCNASGTGCRVIPGATGQSYTLAASDIGRRVRVLETASTATATSVPASSRATAGVLSPTPLYWLYTASGNVNQSPGTIWYGSPSAHHYRGASITGMAATADGRGYWLVTRAGSVYAYGDAARLPGPRQARPIQGIAAGRSSGYWLYSASGNVYASRGMRFYGSPAGSGYRGSAIVGMAATVDGRGYWLVTRSGRVYAFGDARRVQTPHGGHPILGVVAAPGGYWLYTASGQVYPSPGAATYGSLAASGFRGTSVVGMAATRDGNGYWLVTRGGVVYAYGDALVLPRPAHAHPIAGIVGG